MTDTTVAAGEPGKRMGGVDFGASGISEFVTVVDPSDVTRRLKVNADGSVSVSGVATETTLAAVLAAIQALTIAAAIPTLMSKNFSVPANTQALFHQEIATGPFEISIGANAVLVRV